MPILATGVIWARAVPTYGPGAGSGTVCLVAQKSRPHLLWLTRPATSPFDSLPVQAEARTQSPAVGGSGHSAQRAR
eukprot:7962289-Alexandrium_andersonii.AAC.1